MNTSISRIAELVAWGVSAEKIAAALGITQARLVEILETSAELKDEIRKKSAQLAVKDLDKRVNVDTVEQTIIERMAVVAEEETDLAVLARSLDLLRASEAKASGNSSGQQKGAEVNVYFNLGAIAESMLEKDIPIQKNLQSEIVSIGERTMATMPSQNVVKLVEEKNHAESESEATEERAVGFDDF